MRAFSTSSCLRYLSGFTLFSFTPSFLQKFRRNLRWVFSVFFSTIGVITIAPAYGTAITDIGSTGTDGANAVVGKVGGNGGSAGATFLSSDFFNTATATAGNGDKGGTSLLLIVPGGRGGNGGNANTAINSGNQIYSYEHNQTEGGDTALSHAGNGGDGGGLIAGDGGAGGRATASTNDTGGRTGDDPNTGEVFGDAPYSFNAVSTAIGGNGGKGLRGGAGGSGDAQAQLFNPISAGNAAVARASGGNGGDAILSGGKGGSAHADATLTAHGYPADNSPLAVATGGNGGTSTTGFNGDGGDAVANAQGDHYARDFGIDIRARAVGGNSGTGSLLNLAKGNGGNASATANGVSGSYTGAASAYSSATGGAGAERGGYAIATAQQTSPTFGNASADAHGGTGPRAGSAVATAVSNSGYLYNSSDAVATYAGPFARQVTASANAFVLDNPGPSVIYTQARAGDAHDLLASAPIATNATMLARGVIATSSAEISEKLGGNTTIKTAFGQGKVWGFGELRANSDVDVDNASISYVFDVNQYANPEHLWLGLLDTSLDESATGNFHFTVTGEGTTLFDREFTGFEFLSAFNDQLLDLGAWRNLVGVDGLFDLNVSFSGAAPDIQFAFADVSANSSSVPEPSTILLFLPGLIALLISKRLRS